MLMICSYLVENRFQACFQLREGRPSGGLVRPALQPEVEQRLRTVCAWQRESNTIFNLSDHVRIGDALEWFSPHGQDLPHANSKHPNVGEMGKTTEIDRLGGHPFDRQFPLRGWRNEVQRWKKRRSRGFTFVIRTVERQLSRQTEVG